jgi:hypothetical protein
MNRENAGCNPRYFIYDPQDFLLCPGEALHDTISGCTLFPRGIRLYQISTSQTDHAPIDSSVVEHWTLKLKVPGLNPDGVSSVCYNCIAILQFA